MYNNDFLKTIDEFGLSTGRMEKLRDFFLIKKDFSYRSDV